MLQGLIENSLGKRRIEIFEVMKKIKKNTQDIEQSVDVISKEVNLELEGIIKRLDSAAGGKVSILQRDIAFLQRDIIEIDDISQAFDTIMAENDPISFLMASRMFKEETEKIITKTFKGNTYEF
jgi:hypothetical protein